MPNATHEFIIGHLPDDNLIPFCHHLSRWLATETQTDLDQLTESRVRALLLGASAVDDPTLHDFERLLRNPPAQRVALHDLLQDSDLAKTTAVTALTALLPNTEDMELSWSLLALLAYAYHAEYPPTQLDPASPPDSFSPAGQVVKRTAHFLRRQIQRSATDRDKLARKLAYTGPSSAQSLAEIEEQAPVAPLPPHYRPPIPVRYPEVSRDTLHIEPPANDPPAVTRGEQITITTEDLATEERSQPTRMPPIRIDEDDIPATPAPRPHAQPRPASPTPAPSRSGFTDAVRNMLGQDKEPLTTTKLRVVVQEYPDGPGLYGLQVEVRCKGINSFVAGTTSREGQFLCELPVKLHSGLTYDVSVTWPRDFGSEVEQKAMTLNADRTEFTLPFYMHHSQQG